jgi:hypothetical protein
MSWGNPEIEVGWGLTEKDMENICSKVAVKSKLPDFEEAFAIALLGFAKGLRAYDPARGVKASTLCYKYAVQECQTERAKMMAKCRGWGFITVSIDKLKEHGYEIADNGKIVGREWNE